METKIKNTKKEIFETFNKLGWSFKHHGCGFYNFVNPKSKELDLEIWFPGDGERAARVEKEFDDGSIYFELDRCEFTLFTGDDNFISLSQKRIKNPPCFINFSNYDLRGTTPSK